MDKEGYNGYTLHYRRVLLRPPGQVLNEEPAVLEWEVWLARRRPGPAAAVVAAAGGAAAVAYLLLDNLAMPLLTLAVLAGATGEFLFPTRYRLSAAGAEARNFVFWRRIEWTQVRRVLVGEEEVKLSPLPRGGRREAFRGVLLRCEGNREAVLAAVRTFRDALP